MQIGLGIGALGSLVASGCSHAQHHEPQSCSCVAFASPHAPTTALAQTSQSSELPVYVSTAPITPEVAIIGPERAPEAPPTQTVAAKPVEELPSAIETAISEPVAPETHEEKVPRRSFADITVKPGYDHAPDYSWLTGELQYVHSRQIWRVRYAGVDQDDRYGGGMTLVDTGSMSQYKDGQMVRVDGHPSGADSQEGVYKVRNIQVLANP